MNAVAAIAWVCANSAFAASPEVALPAEPELREPLPAQCAKNVALVPGRPVPAELLATDGTVVCGAVAVPTSFYAELLDVESAYAHLRTWTKLELTKSAVLLEASQRETDWWRSEATQPLPVHMRPWYNQTLGAGTVLLGAVAVQLATRPIGE